MRYTALIEAQPKDNSITTGENYLRNVFDVNHVHVQQLPGVWYVVG